MIPLGKLTFLVGEPGLGKGFLAVDIAARVSRGMGWPSGPRRQRRAGSVILLQGEDDPQDTMSDRLQAAGARMHNILTFQMKAEQADARVTRPFSLREDIGSLESVLLENRDCRLVIIDPISAYLGSADANSNTEVRSLLYPLAEMAKLHRVAILIVAHLNKRPSASSLNRVMGALSFVATARSVWGVLRDPKDASQRLMLSMKNNIAVESQGMTFQLRQAKRKAAAHVVWGKEPVTMTFQEACARSPRFLLAERKYRDTEDFVTKRLAEELAHGPINSLTLRLHVPGTEEQQARAAERLGVKKVKDGFIFGWNWMLPQHYPAWKAQRDKQRADEERERKQRHNRRAKERRAAQKKDSPKRTDTDGPLNEKLRKRPQRHAASKRSKPPPPQPRDNCEAQPIDSASSLPKHTREFLAQTMPGVPLEAAAEYDRQRLEATVQKGVMNQLIRTCRAAQGPSPAQAAKALEREMQTEKEGAKPTSTEAIRTS